MNSVQIETFEVDEAVNNQDDAATFRELTEKLGLTKQQELIKDGGKVMPYRKMTQEERIIYGAYLPSHQDVTDFNNGVIPIRVLQVLEHAKSLNFFEKFEVWQSPEDPLLLGRKGWGEYYLLARWGKELESYETIKKKIVARLRNKVQALAATMDDTNLLEQFSGHA